MKRIVWMAIVAALVTPLAGWAGQDPCDQDRAKYCSDVQPGKGAQHNCLMANLTKVTPECSHAVQNSEQLVQQFIQTCQNDTRRFCAVEIDLRPNDVVDCMRSHKDQYSMECQRIYRKLKAYNYPVLQ